MYIGLALQHKQGGNVGDITDRTKIPLFAVIASVFAGGGVLITVVWMAAMSYSQGVEATRVNAAQDVRLDKQSEKIEQLRTLLLDIRDRTVRIEERQRMGR